MFDFTKLLCNIAAIKKKFYDGHNALGVRLQSASPLLRPHGKYGKFQDRPADRSAIRSFRRRRYSGGGRHREPSAGGIIEILHQTQGSAGFTHSSRLWDFRKAVFNLSNDDLRKVATFATRGEGPAGRLALLVSIDLSFGVSRIYETYRKSEKTRVKVFRKKQEAVQWLKA